jgi:hypothetical protein
VGELIEEFNLRSSVRRAVDALEERLHFVMLANEQLGRGAVFRECAPHEFGGEPDHPVDRGGLGGGRGSREMTVLSVHEDS